MIEKFVFDFGPDYGGGYVTILWRGIKVGYGRPWIKDPHDEDYSELLVYLWDKKDLWESKR